ncbi:MAG: hypothetical protein FJ086_01710 [Deltaproteobacteria bacterium]|nr:hypothetical protein [Deltaproteobacteria bacterium]
MSAALKPAITRPELDVWLAGGLSLVAMAVLGVLAVTTAPDLVNAKFLWLNAVINGPHFLVSYRLLYASRENARRYPWASLWVPLLLLAWGAVALGLSAVNPDWSWGLDALFAVNAVYLSLHYTGQAWGMVSTFSQLEGLRFAPAERTLLRLFLRGMAAWHVHWLLRQTVWTPGPEHAALAHGLEAAVNAFAAVSLVVGLATLWRAASRSGHRLPARVAVPYLALHAWYLLLFLHPGALFWVQIAHALQYLPFPLRVELNRQAVHADAARRTGVSMAWVLGASVLVFAGLPWLSHVAGPLARSGWEVAVALINIHHYFIDGCIWHIRNPVVSEELFAHIRRAPPATTPQPGQVAA